MYTVEFVIVKIIVIITMSIKYSQKYRRIEKKILCNKNECLRTN